MSSSALPTSIGIGPSIAGSSLGGNVGLGGIGGGHVDGAAGAVGVSGTGVLALTGAGPGTLLLALTGLITLILGAVAMLTGRKLLTTSDTDSPLRDLSGRVGELA